MNNTSTVHVGDLTITKSDAKRYAHITDVTGHLYVVAEGASLSALTSIGGGLYIRAEGASMPVLTSVGCGL
jgi:hypothetical protein